MNLHNTPSHQDQLDDFFEYLEEIYHQHNQFITELNELNKTIY